MGDRGPGSGRSGSWRGGSVSPERTPQRHHHRHRRRAAPASGPRSTGHADAMVREADAERRRGSDAGYRSAILLYDDALQLLRADKGQPMTTANALSSRARCCEALGEPVAAIKSLTEAIALPLPRASMPQLLVQRAELYLANGTPDMLGDLREAIRLSAGAVPGGLAFTSHTRARELLGALTQAESPIPEPEVRGKIVAEFNSKHDDAGVPIGIVFAPTAGPHGLEVTGIAVDSPAARDYPELGPGCLLVAIKTLGNHWVELEGKSSSHIQNTRIP